jgi:GT2 family glycosyltransferase
LPFASVLILTRNRARWLAGALEALRRLDYPAYEVVVVDHGSTDDTAALVDAHAVRRVSCPPAFGIGRCRQVGLEAARGLVVAWCDDDCRPAPSWLRTLVERLTAEPELGLLGGQVVNVGFPESKRFKGRTRLVGPNGVLAFAADPAEAEFFGNANLAFRREVVERCGGYDPFFHAGAEIDLALAVRRCGYRVAYEAGAVVEHHFTGVDHKHGRLFRSGELMRLYRHLKHAPPRGARGWSRFWLDEARLLAGDLRRAARGAGSALRQRDRRRLGAAAVDAVSALSARVVVPWLALPAGRARRRLEAAALAAAGDPAR